MRPVLISLLAFGLCLTAMGQDKPAGQTPPIRTPEPIKDPRLENAFKFTDKIWGGAEPHDEEAFKSLQVLGVKTIISVDGARPDLDLARKYGMKYVHLPFGYDEVPAQRARELAKAFNEVAGPVFVHCHHGKHRSPAAVATGCVVNGTLSNDEGIAAMKSAGTGENYLGLWDSTKNARPMERQELDALRVTFVDQAPLPPIAEAMVEIDKYFSHLKHCKTAGWRQPKDHPDLDPAHEALKLREIMTELMRKDEFKPHDYKKWTEESESSLKSLEASLRAWKSTEPTPPMEIDIAFKRISQSCTDCHTKYRNVPQRKK